MYSTTEALKQSTTKTLPNTIYKCGDFIKFTYANNKKNIKSGDIININFSDYGSSYDAFDEKLNNVYKDVSFNDIIYKGWRS